jgi:hypothetical protein
MKIKENHKSTIFLITTIVMSHVGYAQKVQVTISPEHRDQASLIYHPPGKSLLFIGGMPTVQDSIRSDVWKWDGANWNMMDAVGPGSRAFFYGTINPKTNQTLHFAGWGLGGMADTKNDLWSFDGKRWTSEAINDIGKRHHHRIVYIDHLNALLVYGGYNSNNKADTTTWLMQNGKFTPMHIPGPGVRYQFNMCYDKQRKKVVLYGGGDRADEHWEFDGKKWEQVATPANPGIKFHHKMTYDENLKAIVLHGGWINLNSRDPKNSETPATWIWDGKKWTAIAKQPVFAMDIAYYPPRKSVIAYGYNEGLLTQTKTLGLWELKNGTWTQLADYGKWNTIDYLKIYLEKYPDDVMALMTYANQLKAANKLPEAEIAFKKLISNFPQNNNALSGLIETLILQNKINEAESYLSAMKSEGSRDMYARMGTIFHGSKQYLLAATYFEKAIAFEATPGEYYNLGCVYSLSGNKDKAFEALHKAIELGYNKKNDYEFDTDLTPLKQDAQWNELIKKLK